MFDLHKKPSSDVLAFVTERYFLLSVKAGSSHIYRDFRRRATP